MLSRNIYLQQPVAYIEFSSNASFQVALRQRIKD